MSDSLPPSPSPVNGDNIRKAWHNGEWFYSVVDMVATLLDSEYDHARKYWKVLKQRLKAEGSRLVLEKYQLKLPAADGRMRLTDVVNTEQALRLIQSIPSPKVEPMKLWLAQVGAERLEEARDPEAVDLHRQLLSGEPDTALARQRRKERRLERYRDIGRDEDWIATRELSIITRKQFINVIHALLGDHAPYGMITNDVYRGVFDKDTSQLREYLGLKHHQNPRDHFSRLALAYTITAEEACKIKLAPYADDDLLPISVVRDVVLVLSKAVGIQADEMANLLNIDLLTGKPLLTQGKAAGG